MSTTTPAAIRQAAQTALAALSGWTVSPWPYGLDGKEGASTAHLSFTVGVTESRVGTGPERQKASEGVFGETTIAVRFYSRLKQPDLVAAYDQALADELLAVAALRAADFLLVSVRRQVDGDGFMITDLQFRALHRYPLS